jgi:WS/DGAT/MGAT family acyltransferase
MRSHRAEIRWLSGTDSLFVSLERPIWSQNIACVLVLDGPMSTFDGLDAISAIGNRISRVPRFRWRLKETPFGLGRPAWVVDQEFDLVHHIRCLTLPSAERRDIGDVIGSLISQPLDRRFPLWQLTCIEGMPERGAVIVATFHHSIADGRHLASFVSDMLDDAADAGSQPTACAVDEPALEPSSLELLGHGLFGTMATPMRLVRYAYGLAGRISPLITAVRSPDTAPFAAARSSFNGAVGKKRTFAFASVSLVEVLEVSKVLGVTVNDVVLAIVAGAVRTFLQAIDTSADRPLVASVPMSTADLNARDSLNDVVNMWVNLPTHEPSPLQRVQLIHRSTKPQRSSPGPCARRPWTRLARCCRLA